MFKTRLISGIILVILAFGTTYAGGDILLLTLLVISLIGVSELLNVVETKRTILGGVVYLAVIAYYIALRVVGAQLMLPIAIACLIGMMMVYVFSYPKFNSEQVATSYFGFFYVAVMLSFIYQTRILEGGIFLVGLVFLSSWGCDTCAYCAGMLFGKHKMSPKLSPKKSVEGGVGGLLGAAILGALFALAVGKWGGVSHSPLSYALICFVGGMISMVGDLAASAIKRNKGIKDYGKLIPGHGGILDRFDSVIFTAPVIYYLAIVLL